MDENGVTEGDNFENMDKQTLINGLIQHEIYHKNINSIPKVANSPEFQVLNLIREHSSITFKSLLEKFDTKTFLVNLISRLIDKRVITREDGQIKLSEEFIKFLTGKEDPSERSIKIPTEKPPKIQSESPPKLQTQPPSTEQVEVSSDSIGEKPSQIMSVSSSKEPEPKKKTEPKIEKKISEEQLSEIDEKLSGSRSRRDKLLSQLSAQSPSDDQEETKSEGDDELDDLFDDVLGESLEDVMSEFEELQISESREPGEMQVIGPIVDLLRETDYIKESTPDETASDIPAYQVLTAILAENPISTEKIEENMTSSTPMSMLLSNLKADDLIAQTNDYRWTLSKKTLRSLKKYIDEKKVALGSEKEVNEDEKLFDSLIDNEIQQFKEAMQKLGYIYETHKALTEYLHKPEVEVLNILRTKGAMDSDSLKRQVDNIMPVVVSRMISRLHADGAIVQNIDDKWIWSPKFKFLMVEDKLRNSMKEAEFEKLEQKYR